MKTWVDKKAPYVTGAFLFEKLESLILAANDIKKRNLGSKSVVNLSFGIGAIGIQVVSDAVRK